MILGGTSEASALAKIVAAKGLAATLSYAGRTASPKAQPLAVRIGGFGGVAGLARYLSEQRISHLIDATHPFAAQISANAVAAAKAAGVPLAALVRPPWSPVAGDRWQCVEDIPTAVAALSGPSRRVMLALGRLHLAAFAAEPQHHYLLRLVDPPTVAPPLPKHTVIVARGPFDVVGDTRLLQTHEIETVVAKNAGGTGAAAKLAAARALQRDVVLIDRPPAPQRTELTSPEAVLDWLAHGPTPLGV